MSNIVQILICISVHISIRTPEFHGRIWRSSGSGLLNIRHLSGTIFCLELSSRFDTWQTFRQHSDAHTRQITKRYDNSNHRPRSFGTTLRFLLLHVFALKWSDSLSDKVYWTQIDKSTLSGLHKMNKYTNNTRLWWITKSYLTAGIEATWEGRVRTAMMECTTQLIVISITDGRYSEWLTKRISIWVGVL